MYEFFEGILKSVTPQYIVINVNGVGYKLITANPFRWQDFIGQTVNCQVELVVREDSMTLYGFFDLNEKELFHKLNKVSGIGPKSALSILALNDHEGLVQAIESGDSQYLTKFPGVGKKTAQQMILDLKGKLDFASELINTGSTISTNASNGINAEVMEALEGLGYSQREIKRVEKLITDEQFTSTQEGLSFAFKLLIKN
ncbi:Holliday junction branch migration protein RuvA [Aerococcaceae bacterium DSM 111021]|nr:Holliday junction branch migration protein RuvA [Aerococcaceae bacterium DSM 111021]